MGLGKNAPDFYREPILVKDLLSHSVCQVRAHGCTSAALDVDGKLYIWGSGVWGGFPGANRVRGFSNAPTDKNIAQFGLGRDGMVWVLTEEAQLLVWGSNKKG